MARSDNWRINKSGIMSIEGAQVLKSLQKVAGAAGLPKNFRVKFASKANLSGVSFEDKVVTIGAGRLFTEAPMASDSFDILVGLTLHEVGHEQIQTERVEKHLDIATRAWAKREADVFHKFANIGEDIAIESRIRANPNLAEYDEIMHKWCTSQMRDADPYKLLEVWIEYALGHKSTTVLNLPEAFTEPMHQLVSLTGWLRKGVVNPIDRATAYLNYWSGVREAILNPPKPPEPEPEPEPEPTGEPCEDGETGTKEPQPEPPTQEPDKQGEEPPADSAPEEEVPQDSDEQDGEADGTGDEGAALEPDGTGDSAGNGADDELDTGMERPLTPSEDDAIDDELAEAIENAIESELEDITDEVAEAFGEQQDSYHRPLTVIRSRESKTPLIKPNALLRKKLERILTIRKRLQSRTMHGEQYGRIDKRHLHRVGTDERIFSLRYKFPDGFPDTRILIDLSSSMNGREADEALEAAGALQTLVNAEVWCYNNSGGSVNLVRMDEGKLIHRFAPAGNTPSGTAIVGVSLGMKKNGLVIHLTDGEHNSGQTPWTANWILKKRGVNLVNLIWGRQAEQYNLDGINHTKIDGLAAFPEALYKILVEQSRLKKIGGG